MTTTRWRVVVMGGVGAATAFALLLGELGLASAIAAAFDDADLDVVGQAVDQGDGAGGVGEDGVPKWGELFHANRRANRPTANTSKRRFHNKAPVLSQRLTHAGTAFPERCELFHANGREHRPTANTSKRRFHDKVPVLSQRLTHAGTAFPERCELFHANGREHRPTANTSKRRFHDKVPVLSQREPNTQTGFEGRKGIKRW